MKKRKWRGAGKSYIIKTFLISTLHIIEGQIRNKFMKITF
jgi:hypothetical protein